MIDDKLASKYVIERIKNIAMKSLMYEVKIEDKRKGVFLLNLKEDYEETIDTKNM